MKGVYDMKKIWILGLFCVLSAIQANAAGFDIRIDRVTGYYAGSGGEFQIIGISAPYNTIVNQYNSKAIVSTSFGTGFEVFCLEETELVDIPQFYYASIDKVAINGGSGPVLPDPISMGTAWLYRQFVDGNLANYDYTPGAGRAASANLLQQAIWYLEHEPVSVPNPLLNLFYADVLTKFTDLAGARADYDGSYGSVKALNLYADENHTILKQSQVVFVPDGGLTVLLLGLGVGGLSLLSNRFKK